MNDPITKKVADKALEPLVKFRKKRPGTGAEIARELNKRTGQNWQVNKILIWLHPDPAKRRQPTFGAGLLLLEVGREIMARDQKSNGDE